MKIQKRKTQKMLKKVSTRTGLAMLGALFLAGNIWMVYRFTQASASDYSLTTANVALDGTNDSTATIYLKTSVARAYALIQGDWSPTEEGSTSYLSITGLKRGESMETVSSDNFNPANGRIAWTPSNGVAMEVPANGRVLAATYKVDKNTPAGDYTIRFHRAVIDYSVNGSDVPEDGNIDLTTTVRVTRSGTGGNTTGGNATGGNATGGNATGGNATGGNATGGNATGGNATGGNATGGNATGGNATGGSGTSNNTSGKNGTAVPNTGAGSNDDESGAAVVSVISIIAMAILIPVTTVEIKSRKRKVGFNK